MSKLDGSENNTQCNTEKISMDKIIRDIEKGVEYFCSSTGEAYLNIINEKGISFVSLLIVIGLDNGFALCVMTSIRLSFLQVDVFRRKNI